MACTLDLEFNSLWPFSACNAQAKCCALARAGALSTRLKARGISLFCGGTNSSYPDMCHCGPKPRESLSQPDTALLLRTVTTAELLQAGSTIIDLMQKKWSTDDAFHERHSSMGDLDAAPGCAGECGQEEAQPRSETSRGILKLANSAKTRILREGRPRNRADLEAVEQGRRIALYKGSKVRRTLRCHTFAKAMWGSCFKLPSAKS